MNCTMMQRSTNIKPINFSYTFLYILCQLAFSGYPDDGFSVLFPQLYGKCQGILRKDGARSALFLITELCCSMHCLCRFVVCVLFVCKCVLYYCHRVVIHFQLNISYHIISYHIISYHIISYHIISYHIISYHVISYHIISYHIISYHIISYHIISYRIVSYRIVSYRIISYHIISYHIISYDSSLGVYVSVYNIVLRGGTNSAYCLLLASNNATACWQLLN